MPAATSGGAAAGRGRRLAVVALAVASGLLALVVAEAGLRALAGRRTGTAFAPTAPWLVPDRLLGHANRPGFVDAKVGVTIGARGYRGPAVAPAKAPGTVRIACLGDSTTFGMWREGMLAVRFDTSYPAELARLYAEDGQPVEVINAGVMGYTAAHALRLLLTRVRGLAPDVVTLRLGNNDHTLLGAQPWWISGAVPYALLRRLPTAAFDWELVRVGIDAYQRVTAPSLPAPPVYKVPLPEFERDLHRLVAAARDMGARPLFLDFPYRPVDQGSWRGEPLPNESTEARSLDELHAIHARYQAVVARVAADEQAPLVRTAPSFTDFDNSHPNAAGLREIAQRLRAALRELGWDAITRPASAPPR